jgi:hypothetical protein
MRTGVRWNSSFWPSQPRIAPHAVWGWFDVNLNGMDLLDFAAWRSCLATANPRSMEAEQLETCSLRMDNVSMPGYFAVRFQMNGTHGQTREHLNPQTAIFG